MCEVRPLRALRLNAHPIVVVIFLIHSKYVKNTMNYEKVVLFFTSICCMLCEFTVSGGP